MVIRRPSNLSLAIAAAVLGALLLALELYHLPWAALVGVPLVLWLPGYALTYALFGKNTLGGAERLLLSAGLSIAVAILGGTLLNLTPWGLQANTWLLLLVIVTVGAGALALVRRHAPVMTVLQVRPAFKPLNLVLYGISAALLVLGLWIASLPAPADRVQGYSALWMLPPETNAGRTVKIGIQSTELQTTSYELRVQVNDQIIQEWRDIILETGQGWSNSFQLPPTANASQVQAKLYRTDQPDTVYRIVHFQP